AGGGLFPIRHAARDQSCQPGRLHSNLSWTYYRTLAVRSGAPTRMSIWFSGGAVGVEPGLRQWAIRRRYSGIHPGEFPVCVRGMTAWRMEDGFVASTGPRERKPIDVF